MFDKNAFKDAFRAWATAHPCASESEAKEFCQSLVPADGYAQHYWLIEQSLQWFLWTRRRDRFTAEELAPDEEDERLVC